MPSENILEEGIANLEQMTIAEKEKQYLIYFSKLHDFLLKLNTVYPKRDSKKMKEVFKKMDEVFKNVMDSFQIDTSRDLSRARSSVRCVFYLDDASTVKALTMQDAKENVQSLHSLSKKLNSISVNLNRGSENSVFDTFLATVTIFASAITFGLTLRISKWIADDPQDNSIGNTQQFLEEKCPRSLQPCLSLFFKPNDDLILKDESYVRQRPGQIQ